MRDEIQFSQKATNDLCKRLALDKQFLEAENARLREALGNYGRHKRICACARSSEVIEKSTSPNLCGCGFSTALEGNNEPG